MVGKLDAEVVVQRLLGSVIKDPRTQILKVDKRLETAVMQKQALLTMVDDSEKLAGRDVQGEACTGRSLDQEVPGGLPAVVDRL